MERYLIINADDYGMCLSANDAVEHLFNEGYITSTTLMTPCPWAEDALARAKANTKIRVGLHLTMNAEWSGYKWGPVCKDRPVLSLINTDGYFHPDTASFLKAAKSEDIVAEMEAQLGFMNRRGYRPTHIDNHMGSLYGIEGPSYLAEVFALCAKHGFDFRLPRSYHPSSPIPDEMKRSLNELAAAADQLKIGIIDYLCSYTAPLTPDDTYETVRDHYLDIIRSAQEGITELYIHPAKETEELKAICPGWQQRVWEYRLMLDDLVIKTIQEEGIQLVGWTDAPFKKK